jgi:hypothetical protein
MAVYELGFVFNGDCFLSVSEEESIEECWRAMTTELRTLYSHFLSRACFDDDLGFQLFKEAITRLILVPTRNASRDSKPFFSPTMAAPTDAERYHNRVYSDYPLLSKTTNMYNHHHHSTHSATDEWELLLKHTKGSLLRSVDAGHMLVDACLPLTYETCFHPIRPDVSARFLIDFNLDRVLFAVRNSQDRASR